VTPDELSEADVAAAIGPLDGWSHECHAASLRLVNSGLLPDKARVARGTLPGIRGQHSWAVVGSPYRPDWIVDVTAWSYAEEYERVLVVPHGEDRGHRPHGFGDIARYGWPICGDGVAVSLAVGVNAEARRYLRDVAEANGRKHQGIDIRGWLRIANGPMQGWPAAEIIGAMCDTPVLAALVPIDIVGMVTDRNPDGLYLPSPAPDLAPDLEGA
jgi:hypothetical protein